MLLAHCAFALPENVLMFPQCRNHVVVLLVPCTLATAQPKVLTTKARQKNVGSNCHRMAAHEIQTSGPCRRGGGQHNPSHCGLLFVEEAWHLFVVNCQHHSASTAANAPEILEKVSYLALLLASREDVIWRMCSIFRQCSSSSSSSLSLQSNHHDA